MAKGVINEEIRNPEVLTEIGRAVGTGMDWTALKKHLKNKYNIEANVRTIKAVYSTYVVRRGEIINGDKEIKQEIKEEVQDTILNTRDTLKKIHAFTDQLLERAKGKDDRLALDCAKEILNQLSFQEKLLNKMQAGINVTNLTKIDMVQIVNTQFDQLQKSGHVKVVDVSLEQKPVNQGGQE